MFGFSFADSGTFTTIFVQKRIDNFVNSMNDGKIKIRYGSVEISGNVDKRCGSENGNERE